MSFLEIVMYVGGALLSTLWCAYLGLLGVTVVAAVRCVAAPSRQNLQGVARLVATDALAFEALFLVAILAVIAVLELAARSGDSWLDFARDDREGVTSTSWNVSVVLLMFGALAAFSAGIWALWSPRLRLRRPVIAVSLAAFVAFNVFVFAIA